MRPLAQPVAPSRAACVAAGSSVWPAPPLSWRSEVAQGHIQGQLWEPQEATPTQPQGPMKEVRHWCSRWRLFGFAQPVSATRLLSANVKWYWEEMCFHGEKGSTGEVVNGNTSFMGMDIFHHREGHLGNCWSAAHNGTPHDHKSFTFL